MGIRANTGLVSIEVNDNGDKINFSISDNAFLSNFSDFAKWFFESKDKIGDVGGLDNGGVDADNFSQSISKFDTAHTTQEELSHQTLDRLEDMFGAGTCAKIFGDISPTFICVADVVSQLVDEINRVTKENNAYYNSKYNSGRKGARSK